MRTYPTARRLLATAALISGLTIGLAANAGAAPVSDDFWECAADHPDDIGVCCVFYGGDYDERTGGWIEHELTADEPARPAPKPVLTPASRAPASFTNRM